MGAVMLDLKAKERVKAMIKDRDKIRVQDFIPIHMVYNLDGAGVWMHTHGMWELFGLPDLEIRNVLPRFLVYGAGMVINDCAQYMVDSSIDGKRPLKANERIMLGPALIQVKLSTPYHPDDAAETKGHFTTPRYELVEVAEQFRCVGCEDPSHKH